MIERLSFEDRMEVSVGRGAPLHDQLPIRGHVLVELYGPDGQLKRREEVDNLVVDAGKAHVADRLSTTPGGAAMGWMAIGTGATAPAAANTALGTEIDRNATTSITDAANVVTYVGNWPPATATTPRSPSRTNAVRSGRCSPGDVHGDQQGRVGHVGDHRTVTIG
jgi:hypothetical protein